MARKLKRKKRKTRKNPAAVPGMLGLAVAGGIGYLLYTAWKSSQTLAANRYPLVRL